MSEVIQAGIVRRLKLKHGLSTSERKYLKDSMVFVRDCLDLNGYTSAADELTATMPGFD